MCRSKTLSRCMRVLPVPLSSSFIVDFGSLSCMQAMRSRLSNLLRKTQTPRSLLESLGQLVGTRPRGHAATPLSRLQLALKCCKRCPWTAALMKNRLRLQARRRPKKSLLALIANSLYRRRCSRYRKRCSNSRRKIKKNGS
jgi:hypothetical protein